MHLWIELKDFVKDEFLIDIKNSLIFQFNVKATGEIKRGELINFYFFFILRFNIFASSNAAKIVPII